MSLHPCPPPAGSLPRVPAETAAEPPGLGDSLLHVAGRFARVSRGGRESGPLSRSKTKANPSWLSGRSSLTHSGAQTGRGREHGGPRSCPTQGSGWRRASQGTGSPSVQLEGVAHFLRWVFHLANSSPACSRQCAQGIFMEEVHASNSLSSSKLAAPAQKDLGAVNNSVWLRDFHFAGPGLLLPQGPARGWLPSPLLSFLSSLSPAPRWRGAPHTRLPQPRPPCFTFCSLPASFLSISRFFVCASPLPSPPLPSPSLPCST